jgi:hypothetical protein
MFAHRHKPFAFLAAIIAAIALANFADAGWVTFKNDTNKAVVVQEVTIVNGKAVRGKPTRLLAGESFREFQNTAGVKSYELFDANSNSLWTGNLNCKNDSQSFSITTAQGKVGVIQVPEPKKP